MARNAPSASASAPSHLIAELSWLHAWKEDAPGSPSEVTAVVDARGRLTITLGYERPSDEDRVSVTRGHVAAITKRYGAPSDDYYLTWEVAGGIINAKYVGEYYNIKRSEVTED